MPPRSFFAFWDPWGENQIPMKIWSLNGIRIFLEILIIDRKARIPPDGSQMARKIQIMSQIWPTSSTYFGASCARRNWVIFFLLLRGVPNSLAPRQLCTLHYKSCHFCRTASVVPSLCNTTVNYLRLRPEVIGLLLRCVLHLIRHLACSLGWSLNIRPQDSIL